MVMSDLENKSSRISAQNLCNTVSGISVVGTYPADTHPLDEVLVKTRDLLAFQKPSNRDYNSVRNWVSNLRPVVEREEAFIKHREDVISLHSGREWSAFDGMMESLLKKLDCGLIRVSFSIPVPFRRSLPA